MRVRTKAYSLAAIVITGTGAAASANAQTIVTEHFQTGIPAGSTKPLLFWNYSDANNNTSIGQMLLDTAGAGIDPTKVVGINSSLQQNGAWRILWKNTANNTYFTSHNPQNQQNEGGFPPPSAPLVPPASPPVPMSSIGQVVTYYRAPDTDTGNAYIVSTDASGYMYLSLLDKNDVVQKTIIGPRPAYTSADTGLTVTRTPVALITIGDTIGILTGRHDNAKPGQPHDSAGEGSSNVWFINKSQFDQPITPLNPNGTTQNPPTKDGYARGFEAIATTWYFAPMPDSSGNLYQAADIVRNPNGGSAQVRIIYFDNAPTMTGIWNRDLDAPVSTKGVVLSHIANESTTPLQANNKNCGAEWAPDGKTVNLLTQDQNSQEIRYVFSSTTSYLTSWPDGLPANRPSNGWAGLKCIPMVN